VSLCETHRKEIEAELEQGLTTKRIHEELVREHGFAGKYQSVKRFVRRAVRESLVPAYLDRPCGPRLHLKALLETIPPPSP
jgi:hypothetical protein